MEDERAAEVAGPNKVTTLRSSSGSNIITCDKNNDSIYKSKSDKEQNGDGMVIVISY